MPTPSAALIEPAWFIVFFVAMWFVIGVALAYGSGWRALAERFRSTHSIEGERVRFVSGSVSESKWSSVQCRGCFFVTVGSEGFLLSAFFLLRLGSPPLFIPWTEVESVTEQSVRFVDCAVICLRGSPTRIMLVGRAG